MAGTALTQATKFRGTRDTGSHFQILIRLQALRRRVHDLADRGTQWAPKSDELDEMLAGVQGVARAARAAALGGFSAVCLHIYERVERLQQTGYLPITTLTLLAEWSANAELYVRRPHRPEFAEAVVEQLNDLRWGMQLDPTEQANLLRNMMKPYS